jgi:hypothetical protein
MAAIHSKLHDQRSFEHNPQRRIDVRVGPGQASVLHPADTRRYVQRQVDGYHMSQG